MIRAIHLLVIAALTLMFAAAASNRAEAGSLIENFSGTFGPTTTLDGTALGSDTNFSFQATFNSTAGTVLTTGVATFASSLSINIAGHGTYTSAPGAVNVIVADPTYNALGGNFGVGLSTSTGSAYFGAAFASASPAFTAETVAPTGFSNFLQYVELVPLTIGLTGGGSLEINDFGSTTATASLTSAAVPEPAALIVAAEAVLLVGVALRLPRRKKMGT